MNVVSQKNAMMKCNLCAICLAFVTMMLLCDVSAFAQGGDRRIFLPVVARPGTAVSGCPDVSSNKYGVIAVSGGFYKGNRLTDENADLRLSVIGYTPVNAPLDLVDYNGDTDPQAPRLSGVFRPDRIPTFARAHKRYDWNWDENGAPPYGARGGVNNDWPVSVLDFAVASSNEPIYIPRRSPEIGGGFAAMALYAAPTELTIVYYRQDSVVDGYLIHMLNFCVDPNLVELYRAQLRDGKRATGNLPGLNNAQPVGVARGDAPLTIAVRDRGGFLDPRSRKDWWP
jgi:hypothetical protein